MTRTAALTTMAACVAIALPAAQVSSQSRAAEVLSQKLKPLTEYRAVRQLDAANALASGSLEVQTTFQNRTFAYKVLSEKGNGFIRKSILKELLRREKAKVDRGLDIDSFTLDNYSIGLVEVAEGGVLKILARPKSKENQYEECVLFMNPAGEITSSIGKVKRPSFMLRNVVARTTFAQINGVRMPVYLKSTAHVLLFGESRFEMRYTYTSVNGIEVKR